MSSNTYHLLENKLFLFSFFVSKFRANNSDLGKYVLINCVGSDEQTGTAVASATVTKDSYVLFHCDASTGVSSYTCTGNLVIKKALSDSSVSFLGIAIKGGYTMAKIYELQM